MAAQLELARRLKIDQSRLSYFWVELTSTGYDVAQAERAEVWIKYGDWTFKGSDPTLELSDFFPSEEQYAQSVAKLNARQAPKVAANTSRSNAEFAEFRKRYIDADGFLS